MRSDTQKGSVLLAVVLALSLIAAVALLLNRGGGMNLESSAGREMADVARAAAEAGLNHTIWQAQQNNCADYEVFTDQVFGSTAYQTAFAPVYTTAITPDNGSPVLVKAKGVLQNNDTERELSRLVTVYEPPITVTLQPDGADMEDTYIDEWKTTWNYGLDTQIRLETFWSDSKLRSLLKFDLSSIASSVRILNATLELYMHSPSATGGPVAVHRVTTDWDEGTGSGGMAPGANWNESASGVPWTAPGGDFDPNPVIVTDVTPYTPGWNSWDIDTLVSGWVSNIYPNQGLMLRLQEDGGGAYFYSSDYNVNPLLRPKLNITFACECGGGPGQTLVLQPDGAGGEDTYLSDSKQTDNFGNDTGIIHSNKLHAKDRGIVRFDLSSIPAGATLDSAMLQMNLESIGSGTSGTAALHRITADWQELQASWKNRTSTTQWTTDGGDYDPLPEVTAAIDPAGGPVTWDVTGLADAWLNSTYPNNGVIMLVSADINNASFTSSDAASASLRPKLTINYSCPCGVDCTGTVPQTNVLFVVGNAATLGSSDSGRKTLMESWGYNVSLIDDDALQADFDTAAAAVDAVYVSATIVGGTLANKLTGSATGILNEFPGKLDNFGFCSTTTHTFSADTFTKTDPGHFITEPFSGNSVNVFTSALSMAAPSGTLAPDLQNVGEVSGQLALVALDTGATGWDTNPIPGRRVHLPYSSAETGDLTGDGETILQRALLWAAGEGSGSGSSLPTETIPAVADTWIYMNDPDTNFGGNPLMQDGANAGWDLMNTMVEFDLSAIPAGATVQTATLRLYVDADTGNAPKLMGLYRVTADWAEGTQTGSGTADGATWNTYDGVNPWATPGGDFDPTPLTVPSIDWSVGWKEWSVPPGLIHEWIDGVSLNYGLLLYYQGDKKNFFLKFATKEHSDPSLHPQLVIEYTE